MKRGWKISVTGLIGLLLAVGLALPVCAQGQTPTQPGRVPTLQPTPIGGEGQQGLGARTPGTGLGRRRLSTQQTKPGQKLKTEKPGTALEGEKAEQKPAEEKKPAAPAKRPPAGTKTVQGPAAGKAAVRTVAPGAAAGVTIKGGANFEPIMAKPLEYGDVPDVGEPLTETGPMSVKEFLNLIATATEWNILVTEKAQGINLQFWLVNTKPKKALEILKFHGIHYQYDPESQYLYVMTREERVQQQYGAIENETFIAQHVSVSYLQSLLESLLSTSGRIIADSRTGHIYVWDTKDNLAKMKETVKELDVPLQNMTFTVQHADLSDVESVLSTFKTDAGAVVADPRTGQILVWDMPDTLRQMKEVVAQIDVPLQSKVFKLQHINAEDVSDSVETLLSERGSIQVDPRFNTLIVTDLPTRQELVAELLETLDKKLDTRTWTVKYAEPDFIAEQVEVILPENSGVIAVNEDIHQVTVTALPERLDEIDKLIQTWDIKRKQVQIEAYLLSASSNVARKLGVNWSYFDRSGNAPMSLRYGSQTPNYATAGSDGTPRFQVGQLPYVNPLETPILGNAIEDVAGNPLIEGFRGNRVSAVIDYLDDKGDVDVLSHPRVTVQDGEEAMFQRTSMVPYVSSTSYSSYGYGYGTTSQRDTESSYAGGRPSNRIEFIEVGTILSVVPRITEDNNILLDISAEESTYQMREVVGASETSTVPEKMQNRAETQVLVHDTQTIVIGGLRTGNLSDSVQKIPFLGDVPVIGRAFRNTKKERKDQELLVFITTTLVDEYTFPEAEQLATVDEKLSDDFRRDDKNDWKRLSDGLGLDKNEISISIGQNGNMHSDGSPMTFEQVRARIAAVSNPQQAKVVLRQHPRAPSNVAQEISDLAREAGIAVEFDKRFMPFVPANRPEEKTSQEGNASEEGVKVPAPENGGGGESAP
jgi:type II secretory pathway component GspD/PulD (secretin)